LLLATLCVALSLAAYFGYHSYQRHRVESARQLLLSPRSGYSQAEQAIDEIAKSGSAGRYAIPELLRHGNLRSGDTLSKKTLDIFRKLGPDAAPAIPDLLHHMNYSIRGEVLATLDAIDPNWRDRPEVPAVAALYINRACQFSNLKPSDPEVSWERRLSPAMALHCLVGDDVAQARRIINRAGEIDKDVNDGFNNHRLFSYLVEHYKGPYYPVYQATVRFLLEVLDSNWDQSNVATEAYPYLVRHLFDWEISNDDPSWIDARDWVVKHLPADVILDGCRSRSHTSPCLSDTAVDLVCQYPRPVQQRLVSVCLQHGWWKYLESPEWHFRLDVSQALRNLSRLDPNWHRHEFAVNAIPALMKHAALGSKEAYELLDKIDPKWFQHPHAKLMVPFLVEQVSPSSRRMTEILRDSPLEPGTMHLLDPLDRAADMLTRLGPNAREAIPKLLVIRAKGIAPKYRSRVHWLASRRIDSLLAKFPDVIDANWPDAVESLAAIPELIALLDTQPATASQLLGRSSPAATAAELLGRFGPVARSALPALKKTLRLPTTRHVEEIEAIEQAITRITPQARPSEQK
jgi:hypothetical protein